MKKVIFCVDAIVLLLGASCANRSEPSIPPAKSRSTLEARLARFDQRLSDYSLCLGTANNCSAIAADLNSMNLEYRP